MQDPAVGKITVPIELDGDGQDDSLGFHFWTHDVDGDGTQDQIGLDAAGRVVLKLRQEGTLAEMEPGVDIGGGTVQYLGDLDGDDRLDVLIAKAEGQLSCVELGDDTYHPWNSWGAPVEYEWVERTRQLDNWEPNDTLERAFRVKNDKTLKRGFISSASDRDFFLVGTPYCGQATIQAPVDVSLVVRLYGDVDRDSDGQPDVLDEAQVTAGTRGSLDCHATANSTSLWPYWVEIASADGSFSSTHPWVGDLTANY
jgi:hypothetical protein